MAINITAYDLLNYPDNGKTITLDLKLAVPVGYGGDERYLLSADTSATASGSATIQESFVDGSLVGWAKSNTRVSSPFSIVAGVNDKMKVAIDEPVGSAITITLTADTSITGANVAKDIESKIRSATVTGGAKAGNLSYLNARCYYENGKFIITSGSVSSVFTGTGRSSVRVAPGATADVSVTLGFDIPLESEALASASIKETYVTSVVSSSTTVPVNSVTGFAIGDCVAFKETTGTITYRYLTNVSAPNFTVNAAVSLEQNAMVQLLRMQDPDSGTSSYYKDIDATMRHAIEKIIRQINFA